MVPHVLWFCFIFSILFSLVTIKYSFKISHCTGLTVSWQVTASQALMNSWSWNAMFAIAKPSLKSSRWDNNISIFWMLSCPRLSSAINGPFSISLECYKWQRWRRPLKMIDFAALWWTQLLNVIGICGWYTFFLNFSSICTRQRGKIIWNQYMLVL